MSTSSFNNSDDFSDDNKPRNKRRFAKTSRESDRDRREFHYRVRASRPSFDDDDFADPEDDVFDDDLELDDLDDLDDDDFEFEEDEDL